MIIYFFYTPTSFQPIRVSAFLGDIPLPRNFVTMKIKKSRKTIAIPQTHQFIPKLIVSAGPIRIKFAQ
jgi:hypothetical protein